MITVAVLAALLVLVDAILRAAVPPGTIVIVLGPAVRLKPLMVGALQPVIVTNDRAPASQSAREASNMRPLLGNSIAAASRLNSTVLSCLAAVCAFRMPELVLTSGIDYLYNAKVVNIPGLVD